MMHGHLLFVWKSKRSYYCWYRLRGEVNSVISVVLACSSRRGPTCFDGRRDLFLPTRSRLERALDLERYSGASRFLTWALLNKWARGNQGSRPPRDISFGVFATGSIPVTRLGYATPSFLILWRIQLWLRYATGVPVFFHP